jgi:hypothetical protein
MSEIRNICRWNGWFMVFNVTFNIISVISWRCILLVEETGVPGENHQLLIGIIEMTEVFTANSSEYHK